MSEFEVRENEHWFREVVSELGTFHAACLHKTRAKAGIKLGKEGQSVGRSIARLEQLLQVELNGGYLVDPSEPRKVEPTDAGKLLQKYCEELIASRNALRDGFAHLQSSSDLRVAATHYAWLAYGQELKCAFEAMRPGGNLDTGGNFWEQDRVWEDIEARVISGEADVGIYSFPPSRTREFPAELECTDFIDEEFVMVLSKDLAKLAKRDKFSIYDLSMLLPKLPKVVHYRRELNFDRTDLIEEYLHRKQVLPRFEGDWLTGVNTIAEMKDSLLQGRAISFLPWPTVAKEHQRGMLKAFPLDHQMRARVIKIITRRHHRRNSVQAFLDAAATIGGFRRFSS